MQIKCTKQQQEFLYNLFKQCFDELPRNANDLSYEYYPNIDNLYLYGDHVWWVVEDETY